MKIKLCKASDYKFEEFREYESWDECISELIEEFNEDKTDYDHGLLIQKALPLCDTSEFEYYVTIADDYLD